MKTIRTLIATACGLIVLGVCGAVGRYEAIESIMEKGFKKGGLRHQIDVEVGKDKPDWNALIKKSKDFRDLCDKLTKEKPPKGEADSWKTHTELMLTEAKSLCDFAEKKDQGKTKLAIKKINSSCKSCHDAHRE